VQPRAVCLEYRIGREQDPALVQSSDRQQSRPYVAIEPDRVAPLALFAGEKRAALLELWRVREPAGKDLVCASPERRARVRADVLQRTRESPARGLRIQYLLI